MSHAVLALVLLAGCWRGDGKAEPVTMIETHRVLCAEFMFKHLSTAIMIVNGRSAAPVFDTADAEAKRDEEQAEGAAQTDMLAAARFYLSCATRYRSVGDDDPLRDTADGNAAICYENAMYAYAMAGRFAAEGKAALERSIAEDPRLAEPLIRMLASPPQDCAVRR